MEPLAYVPIYIRAIWGQYVGPVRFDVCRPVVPDVQVRFGEVGVFFFETKNHSSAKRFYLVYLHCMQSIAHTSSASTIFVQRDDHTPRLQRYQTCAANCDTNEISLVFLHFPCASPLFPLNFVLPEIHACPYNGPKRKFSRPQSTLFCFREK